MSYVNNGQSKIRIYNTHLARYEAASSEASVVSDIVMQMQMVTQKRVVSRRSQLQGGRFKALNERLGLPFFLIDHQAALRRSKVDPGDPHLLFSRDRSASFFLIMRVHAPLVIYPTSSPDIHRSTARPRTLALPTASCTRGTNSPCSAECP